MARKQIYQETDKHTDRHGVGRLMIDVNVYKGHNDMFNGKNNDCWKSILPLINWFNRPSASTYTNNNKNARQGTKIITKEGKENEKGDIA